MIHIGSVHRCIMTTFLINTSRKNIHVRRENKKKKHETIGYVEHEEKEKHSNIKMSELEERYQVIVDTTKKVDVRKKNQVHDEGNNAKDQVEKENVAAEVESTLTEADAQEMKRRSMNRSSTVANQRSVPAQLGHRCEDGWTSTPRGSDDEKKGSESDMTTGSDCRINVDFRLWKSKMKKMLMKTN